MNRQINLTCVTEKKLHEQGYDNLKQWLDNPENVYIGSYIESIPGTFISKWAFPKGLFMDEPKPGTFDYVSKYREYITQKKPDLFNDLHELNGKRLGCLCYPYPCHGDVLIDLINEKFYAKDAAYTWATPRD